MSTKLADVIVPSEFTQYQVQHTMEKSNLIDSGLLVRNDLIQQQLSQPSNLFTVPFWNDLANTVANLSDSTDNRSVPNKITADSMVVRKSFINNSWAAHAFASELAGSSAIKAIQARVSAYWTREMQRRLVATVGGVVASNILYDDGDMVLDVSALTAEKAKFNATNVITAAGSLGDAMGDVTSLIVHSDTYRQLLIDDLIESVQDSNGNLLYQTYRGLLVTFDDMMPVEDGVYTSILCGSGAFGYGVSAPTHAEGTSVVVDDAAGMGASQTVLHSRLNVAVHPSGFSWQEAEIVGESPSHAELSAAANYKRIVERKAVPLAVLKHK